MTAARGKVFLYLALAVFGLLGPVLFPNYIAQMTELWLFVVFALTWDLTGGQMGYNSFGNVVFVGIGVYASAVVQVGMFYDVGAYNDARGGGTDFVFNTVQYLEGIALGLPVAGLVALGAAALLGMAVLGMRGHYFAICTLGLGIAAGEIAAAWEWIGAGSGMTVPEPPATMDYSTLLFYYLAFGVAVATFLTCGWLLSTRFGLAINAIRDDEDKAEALGHFTKRVKVTAWMIAAFFLGFAGAIYGNLKRFIDPIDIAFSGATIGVWMILMAILGGKGSLLGPVIGAIVFQVMKELFWTYLLGWQRVALGMLIVIIVVFFPQGITGWFSEHFKFRGNKEAATATAGKEGSS